MTTLEPPKLSPVPVDELVSEIQQEVTPTKKRKTKAQRGLSEPVPTILRNALATQNDVFVPVTAMVTPMGSIAEMEAQMERQRVESMKANLERVEEDRKASIRFVNEHYRGKNHARYYMLREAIDRGVSLAQIQHLHEHPEDNGHDGEPCPTCGIIPCPIWGQP